MQPEVLKTSKQLIYSGLLQVVQSCSELFLRLYLPTQEINIVDYQIVRC